MQNTIKRLLNDSEKDVSVMILLTKNKDRKVNRIQQLPPPCMIL